MRTNRNKARNRSNCRSLRLAAVALAAGSLSACSANAMDTAVPNPGTIDTLEATESPTTALVPARRITPGAERPADPSAATVRVVCRVAGCTLVAAPSPIPSPLGR